MTPVLALTAALLSSTSAPAQTAYRYRDANGQWVFTDRAPPSATPVDSFNVVHENSSTMHLSVDRTDDAEGTRLIAVNDCLCVVTFEVKITQSAFADVPTGAHYRETLAPGARQALVRMEGAGGNPPLQYVWRAALGSPDAVHSPTRPYRVPFGVGSTFLISQAYPSRITHITPDSQYAVDIALPDGTPVYAAREGTVINARHDRFLGAADPVMLDQANVVEILHADGTIAIYAHLHWDSIRVRIGAHVARGEYIADSGNTGFTSGPHLHFAIIRNAGAADVSVPIEFAGLADAAVTPVAQTPLTAY